METWAEPLSFTSMTTVLTDKQRTLVELYLTVGSPAFGNATKAAKLAGYSPRSAYQIAHATLHKPHIRRLVDRIERQIDREWQEKVARSRR